MKFRTLVEEFQLDFAKKRRSNTESSDPFEAREAFVADVESLRKKVESIWLGSSALDVAGDTVRARVAKQINESHYRFNKLARNIEIDLHQIENRLHQVK